MGSGRPRIVKLPTGSDLADSSEELPRGASHLISGLRKSSSRLFTDGRTTPGDLYGGTAGRSDELQERTGQVLVKIERQIDRGDQIALDDPGLR